MSRTRFAWVTIAIGACQGSTEDPPQPTGHDPTEVSTVGVLDADGDGYDASIDCDDGDAAVHPGASEVCDGIEPLGCL